MSRHTFLALFAGLRALVYVTFFFWFWAWLALSVRQYDEWFRVEWPTWPRAVALVIMAVGAALALTCVGLFAARGRGTPAPFDPPREFVAVGPYKYVRNPMYIGALILLTGYGLWHRSVSMLLFPLLALLAVHLFVVFYEEPNLKRIFGESYLEYRRSVHRWLPEWR